MTFNVIAADPPWPFSMWSEKGGAKGAIQHYETMSIEDIQALPVIDHASDNCALLLWSTWPNLEDCIATGKAWGFEYKTLGFIWIKRTSTGKHWFTGLGYYTRSNTEPCLLFTRGKVPRLSKSVHQIIDTFNEPLSLFDEDFLEQTLVARVGRHSAKPPLFYEKVEKLFAGPYMELFSRTPRTGWTVVGNEVNDGRDVREVLGAGIMGGEL